MEWISPRMLLEGVSLSCKRYLKNYPASFLCTKISRKERIVSHICDKQIFDEKMRFLK